MAPTLQKPRVDDWSAILWRSNGRQCEIKTSSRCVSSAEAVNWAKSVALPGSGWSGRLQFNGITIRTLRL